MRTLLFRFLLMLSLGGCHVEMAPPPTNDAALPPADASHADAGSDASAHDATSPGDAASAHDAHVAPDAGHDAHVAHDAGHDAFVAHDAGHDAHVAHDAYVCPTWSHDVHALLSRHCGGCHTSLAPAFVASVSTARSHISAILTLGTPPGAMSRRDPLGGFGHADVALLHAWQACGMP